MYVLLCRCKSFPLQSEIKGFIYIYISEWLFIVPAATWTLVITCLFRKTQVSSCRRKTSIISEINLTLYSSYIIKNWYPTCELLEKIIGLKTIRCMVNLCPIYNELNKWSKNDLDINWSSLKDLKVKWNAQTDLHRLTRLYIEGRHSIKTLSKGKHGGITSENRV